MRTLKKTLCLVLALVMMLGLCAFSVSADFSDADKITYKEAVGVLTGIGVIKGMGDSANTFNPNGTLTRAQACTIITKLMGADGISAKSTFTDMEGAAWAESYVAYCQAKGIVGGYGDGRFGPNDTLTGSQWGRMLLLAAGFDAEKNGFESGNDSWEIGVAKTVKDQGLAARITGFNGTQGISRDAACEMAFQGMKKSPNGAAGYMCNGMFFADQLAAVLYRSTFADHKPEVTEAPAGDSLWKTNFPGLKSTTGVDAFGRATAGWTYNAKNSNRVSDDLPIYSSSKAAAYSLTVNGRNLMNAADLGTYNATKTEANFVAGLNKALGLSGAKALAAADSMTVKINGAPFTLTSDEVKVSDEIEIVLDTDGKISAVTIIRYQAVVIGKTTNLTNNQINRLVGTPAEGSTTSIDVGGNAVYDKLFAGNSFAEGDYALVVIMTNANSQKFVAAVEPVTSVEGTISRNTAGTLTLAGRAYAPSGIASTDIDADLRTAYTAASIDFTNTWILHLAQDGTYVAIEKKTDKSDTSVAWAIAKYSRYVATAGTEYTDGSATLYYVQCVDLDGQIVNYQVKKATYDAFTAGLKTIVATPGCDADNLPTTSYNYVGLENMTDDSSLTSSTAVSSTAAAKKVNAGGDAITAAQASVNGTNGARYYLTAGQKVIFMSGSLDTLKVTVKTGKTAVDNAHAYTIYGTSAPTSANYNVQAIFVEGAASTASTGTGLIFANETANSVVTVPYTQANGQIGTAYSHNVWIDGEAKEIMTGSAAAINGVFNYTVDDVTGLYTMGAAYETVKSGKITRNNGGMVDIGSSAHEYDIDLSNVKLVNVIADPDAAATAASTAARLTDETITVVFSVANSIWTPTVAYITAAPTSVE